MLIFCQNKNQQKIINTIMSSMMSLTKVMFFCLVVSLATSNMSFYTQMFDRLIKDASSFKGTVALVTGGSTGIGYSTALMIAQKGGHVVFCARDSHPTWYNGSHSEQKIRADPQVILSGGSATFFKADITKPQQVRDLIAFTHEKFGRIDYAILNAGIAGVTGRIDTIEDESLMSANDAIFNNLYGGIICVKEQTKYWMKYGNPEATYSIVMLTSYNGLRACEGCDFYSASKHGIIGLVKSTAMEFATTTPRIRVNGVAPGLTNTFLTRNQVKPNPSEGEAITEDHPLWIKAKDDFAAGLTQKRLAEPSEIATAILYLASNEASYITGTIISVDGGDTAK